MRVDRRTKLHDALAGQDVAAAVLLGTTNVRWATGARVVAAGLLPRGALPAMGWEDTSSPTRRTSSSGVAPTKPPQA